MADQTRLQELHQEIMELKKKRKTIRDAWKDELTHLPRHKEILEEIEALKAEKKSIETQVKESSSEGQTFEELGMEIKSNEDLLSDLALQLVMKNEPVELTDEYKNRWVPRFVVKFKKEGSSESAE